MKMFKHGGNIPCLAREAGLIASKILDFSANINPLGPPEWCRSLISAKLRGVEHYPDPDCTDLSRAFCERWKVSPDEVLFGNGSTEILYLIPRALGRKQAVVTAPAYADYALACKLAGVSVKKLFFREEESFSLNIAALEDFIGKDDLVFIGHPNNPTGLYVAAQELREIACRHPETLFIIDEAFADFVNGSERLISERPANVICLGSLTKFYAIPGLRLGFACARSGLIASLRELMPSWSVNSLAQAVGEAALDDRDYEERSRRFVSDQRTALKTRLEKIPGLFVYPGEANFLLVQIKRGDLNAESLAGRLLQKGIAIRVCNNFDGLDNRFFRVAVRREDENERLCDALDKIFGVPTRNNSGKRQTVSVMFQGTGSNAGKSILAAALCRILLQDGYRVAPFKSQNMSLNSHVTPEEGEMGRAQVVQAQACRLTPQVRMNPILLKPNSETGSQVIIMGKPIGNMDVDTYIRYKPQAFAAAKKAYDSLAAEFDVIVLEGAGSPAEVNLKNHDIANMHMARYAKAPVLLVGDIDRGGVFASFVGTMEVLAEWERDLVGGFIVNRFRGKKSLLEDAFRYTLRHTGRPTFGVVPYIHDLGLPEEDSVTFKNNQYLPGTTTGNEVDIAVIDLPHISNFTDFDALRGEPDVRLRIVRTVGELGRPDALILPGSKNVIGDMDYLCREGFTDQILNLAKKGGTEMIGICGGFQIMGDKISDPHGIESGNRTRAGLALLSMVTVMMPDKTLRSASARHIASGLSLKGYEIHHGQTGESQRLDIIPVVQREDGEMIGLGSRDGLIWGTYLHGIFDADEFRRWFIDTLRKRKGLAADGIVLRTYDLEPAFNRLADLVRENLSIKKIYKLMGLR